MAKRREPGDGSLFYDEERKRWFYFLPRDEMGKRPRVSGKTKAEVLAKAEELKTKRAQGLDLDTKQPTIEQFSEVWLRDVVKRTRRSSTHASYTLYFTPSALVLDYVRKRRHSTRERGEFHGQPAGESRPM